MKIKDLEVSLQRKRIEAQEAARPVPAWGATSQSASREQNLEFHGFDSVRFLILRGGIPRSIGDFPGNVGSEILSLRILSTGRSYFRRRLAQSPGKWPSGAKRSRSRGGGPLSSWQLAAQPPGQAARGASPSNNGRKLLAPSRARIRAGERLAHRVWTTCPERKRPGSWSEKTTGEAPEGSEDVKRGHFAGSARDAAGEARADGGCRDGAEGAVWGAEFSRGECEDPSRFGVFGLGALWVSRFSAAGCMQYFSGFRV